MAFADQSITQVCKRHGRGHRTGMATAQAWLIHQGKSLHLQHGPIDLVITGEGSIQSVQYAYRQANSAFQDVLTTLVAELPQLRLPVSKLVQADHVPTGPVASRMFAVCKPYRAQFVTPMAAVAGAVADHVLQAALPNSGVSKLLVNNGGDIAIYLDQDQFCRVGICSQPADTPCADIISLRACDGIGGVATSGWQGRSHSLGIADAVTVLARDAASADVAATIIANEVDIPNSKSIHRIAANELQDDSDLGCQAVTVAVDKLSPAQIRIALQGGMLCAKKLLQRQLISYAYIRVQGVTEIISAASKQLDGTYADSVQSAVSS